MRIKPPLVSTVTWPSVSASRSIAAWIAVAVWAAVSAPPKAAVVMVLTEPLTVMSSEIVEAAAGDAKAAAVKVPTTSASVVALTLIAP